MAPGNPGGNHHASNDRKCGQYCPVKAMPHGNPNDRDEQEVERLIRDRGFICEDQPYGKHSQGALRGHFKFLSCRKVSSPNSSERGIAVGTEQTPNQGTHVQNQKWCKSDDG